MTAAYPRFVYVLVSNGDCVEEDREIWGVFLTHAKAIAAWNELVLGNVGDKRRRSHLGMDILEIELNEFISEPA